MPKKSIRSESNIDFLKRVMEYSRHGGLTQAFVLDSVEKKCDQVLAAGIEKVREVFGESSFISPDAWFAVAQELKSEFENRRKNST